MLIYYFPDNDWSKLYEKSSNGTEEKESDQGIGKHNQEIKRMMVHNPQILSVVLLNIVVFAANVSLGFLAPFTHHFPFPSAG